MKRTLQTGYSLVELLIVTVLLGILIAFLVPNLRRAVASSNDMASKAYIHHVVKGVEAARDSQTNKLPAAQLCAELTHVPGDPKSVGTCLYEPDLDHDRYTVTVLSVTGKTFRYDGSAVVAVE